MSKEKKQRTPTEEVKHLKRIKTSCFFGQFLSVAAPFITIGIVNFDKYFVKYDGVKMSIASILAAFLMGLAVWLTSKKKFTNSYVTLIIGWAAVTCLFFLLGELIKDVSYIMLFALIGLLGAAGLDVASAKTDAKINQIQEGIQEAKKQMTKDAYLEEVSQEQEKKKIKIKIKKK